MAVHAVRYWRDPLTAAEPAVRIALSTPAFPRSLDHAIAQVERDIEDAARRGARLLCFPESFVPGMRGIDEPVAPHDPAGLDAALARAQAAARRAGIAVILPMDRDRDGKIENSAAVIGADGALLGHQAKNQLDPSEDAIYVPGDGRQLFELAGLRFGIAICHEGFRYPESVRWAARRGAVIVFHPHCTGSNHRGHRLTTWRGPENAYYESAMMCRAMENTIYFASINYAFAFQESATCVVGPTGQLVAAMPYGEAGLLITEIVPGEASRQLAQRFNPSAYGG